MKTCFLKDNFFDQNKSYHLLALLFELPNMPLDLYLELLINTDLQFRLF